MKQRHNSCWWQHWSHHSFFLSSSTHPWIAPQLLNLCTIQYIVGRCISLHWTCTLCNLLLLQICSAFPTSGGLYFWSAQLAGAKWSPFASWITGWYTSSSKISFFLALPDFANGVLIFSFGFSLLFRAFKIPHLIFVLIWCVIWCRYNVIGQVSWCVSCTEHIWFSEKLKLMCHVNLMWSLLLVW